MERLRQDSGFTTLDFSVALETTRAHCLKGRVDACETTYARSSFTASLNYHSLQSKTSQRGSYRNSPMRDCVGDG